MATKQMMKAVKITDILNEEYKGGSFKEAITDLLTDIRHFCDITSVDFFTALRLAGDHHAAEKNGDD